MNGNMNIKFMWMLYVFKYRSLRRSNHSSKGILLSVSVTECECHWVWSGATIKLGTYNECVKEVRQTNSIKNDASAKVNLLHACVRSNLKTLPLEWRAKMTAQRGIDLTKFGVSLKQILKLFCVSS